MFAIDGKHFKAYLNGNTRELAAMHATYRAYRAHGKGLHGAYVKAIVPGRGDDQDMWAECEPALSPPAADFTLSASEDIWADIPVK